MDNHAVSSWRTYGPTWAIVVVAWIGSLVALPFMPAQVPTHWDIHGLPNGYMSRVPGTLFLPALMTGLAIMFLVLPKVDPQRANYPAFDGAYGVLRTAILVFLLGIQGVIIGTSMGWIHNINNLVLIGISLLFIVLGNVLGKIRPNWFVGIRTPWTLSSPDVWTRTHRLGGRLFVALGLVLLFTAVFSSGPATIIVVVGGVLVITVVIIGYSYWVWRQLGSGTQLH